MASVPNKYAVGVLNPRFSNLLYDQRDLILKVVDSAQRGRLWSLNAAQRLKEQEAELEELRRFESCTSDLGSFPTGSLPAPTSSPNETERAKS